MTRRNADAGEARPGGQGTGPVVRMIAKGTDWGIYDITCKAGPHDRPYEERHEGTTIAAVVSGSFTYRGDSGRALLYPGAFLLGNAGRCFECGHDHSTGDRCIASTSHQPYSQRFPRPLPERADSRFQSQRCPHRET